MKLLTKAASIIERDALIARLQAAGVETVSPPRDMSRKVTNDTVDLSLDGYSILFDGFSILVEDQDETKAQQILAEFQAEFTAPSAVKDPADPARLWRRYYFCSLFSLFLPIVMSVAATYYLVQAVQSGERPSKIPMLGYSALYIVGWGLSILAVSIFT